MRGSADWASACERLLTERAGKSKYIFRSPPQQELSTKSIEVKRNQKQEIPMLFDRQKFVCAVHQALKEHDKEKDQAVHSGHLVSIDCDRELEHFADRILELMT
jgi:hypothetical protein